VLQDGELIKYLGCPFGCKISQQQEIQFIVARLQNRLRHWTNQMLSMPSKLILLKHVLKAMPKFYLMQLEFTAEGYRESEAICWQFLWGFNSGGQVPLVALNQICRPHSEGGLGMLDFKGSSVQIVVWSRILGMHNADWIHLACAEIKAALNRGVLQTELKFWTVPKFLLLCPPVQFSNKIIKCLLNIWDAVWPRPKLVPDDAEVTWNLSILHVYCMFHKQGGDFSVPEF
jgi:hypothetical protein